MKIRLNGCVVELVPDPNYPDWCGPMLTNRAKWQLPERPPVVLYGPSGVPIAPQESRYDP